jgi:hypothetical protein
MVPELAQDIRLGEDVNVAIDCLGRILVVLRVERGREFCSAATVKFVLNYTTSTFCLAVREKFPILTQSI